MPVALVVTPGSILSEALVILGIALAVFLIYKIGGFLLKIIFGLIINTVLGFIAILVIDYVFGLGIPLSIPVIVSTAVFGLPAVGVLVILKLFGVPLIAA